jgi:putative alpha-1,2-mannosidase
MVQSLTVKARQGGFLPRWDLAIGETNVMIGTPADIVVAETYLKGITDFDVEIAYDAARKAATKPAPDGSQFALREGIQDYLTFGYLPYDHAVSGTVSRTLEYAIADGALARLAKVLGKTEDFQMFFKNSKNFENLWDDATGYFRPRLADGSFAEPFDPLSEEDTPIPVN